VASGKAKNSSTHTGTPRSRPPAGLARSLAGGVSCSVEPASPHKLVAVWHTVRGSGCPEPGLAGRPTLTGMADPAVRGGCDRTADDDDGLIDQQGCGKLYLQLEECLGEHSRDWRKCQAEVKAWKACYAAFQASSQAPPSVAAAGQADR
jgi:hypothetical protein